MTPTQLRCYATVVRLGSVGAAAKELEVTEAAVSGNVGSLRRELDDRLFRASRQGLVFTPGGLRLAHRAVEMLGLQEQTRREVNNSSGRRLLRVATTSLFAEFAAPGLIEIFTKRADDLDVELIVDESSRFEEQLRTHGVDVAIGPRPSTPVPGGMVREEFLRYDLTAVASPNYEMPKRGATWHLGPSAVESMGVSRFILERAQVDPDNQRIYTNHATAIAAARNGRGVALAPKFAIGNALKEGKLVEIGGAECRATGTWSAAGLTGERSSQVARELMRFVASPRAIQAMLAGAGANVSRFKPSIHVTLWS